MSDQDTYPDLHNARERLCRAQTYIESGSHRHLLQEALDNIDRVGVFLHPSRWSRHDNPPIPGDDR